MSAKSSIEWTEATWNPLVGCTKVSAGCDHCYAEALVNRFAGSNSGFPNRFDVVTLRGEKMLTQPLRWRAPKRIFVNSLSDLFHDDVPDEFIAEVWAVMALAEQHTFQLLTKRHARMRSTLNSERFHGLVEAAIARRDPDIACGPGIMLENVWLGVSVENQQWADIRIPALLDTPAAVRFLSCEPLLCPVDLDPWHTPGDHPKGPPWSGLDWVIVGGESGPGARPMHPDWARSLRDQCAAAGVPFLFKQWGNWAPFPVYKGAEKNTFVMDAATGEGAHYALRNQPGYAEMWNVGKKAAGRELDGRTWDEYPAAPVAAAVRGGS